MRGAAPDLYRLVVTLALLAVVLVVWDSLEGLAGAICAGVIAHWLPPRSRNGDEVRSRQQTGRSAPPKRG